MKRIVTSLLCPLMGVLLMTSCLGSDNETVLSSDVALLSFSIKDLKTTHNIKKENGEDSTYNTVVSGSSVKFVIDQEQRIVYNSDSILFGTDVTHVLVNVTADGGVCYIKSEDEFGSVEDSIDFTNPVVFRVTSNDEKFIRDYTVSINVRQSDPKKTAWKEMDANFPVDLFAEQKAFVKNDSLIVVGKDADGAYHTASTTLADGAAWTTTACSGIQCRTENLSVLLAGDAFYLTADTVLYRSTDGVAWDSITVTPSPLILLAVEDTDTLKKVWGVGAEGFMSSSDMITWNAIGQCPEKAIKGGVASFCQPLRTNAQINRTIFVAMSENKDAYAQVWTKLSTEDSWVEIVPQGTNTYGCPNLQNLAVIAYADNLYAFGGNRKEPIKSFSTCYESRDHGVTWKENQVAFSLPEKFEGRIGTFSATTDGEYVWVMWSNGQVWRGRWNGVE